MSIEIKKIYLELSFLNIYLFLMDRMVMERQVFSTQLNF